MILFDRKYKLTVGGVIPPLADPVTGLAAAGPVNLETRIWSELRVVFTLNKNMDSTSNTGKIEIYNLSKKSQEFLLRSVNRRVQLEVGYGDFLGLMVKADIIDVKRARTRPDIVTTIEYGEGEVAMEQAQHSKTYKKGTTIKTIVLEKVQELKTTIGPAVKGFLNREVTDALGSDLNANGQVKGFLDMILGREGLTWSIQNDEFVINEFVSQNEVYRLDFASGLLQEPEEAEDGKLKVRCLLNPKIIPGKSLQIVTDNLNGIFQVESGVYKGDSFEGEWTIEAEVRAA